MDEQHQTDAAARLLGRLRTFVRDLEADEREMFAVLVGPGMQELKHDDDDVAGFGAEGMRWEPGSLRSQLAAAVEASEWQIVEPR
nr:hypothetical protein [uncultured bacterium]